MAAVLHPRPGAVFAGARSQFRYFLARHTLTPGERAERLAGYSPIGILGPAPAHRR
ncbi:hypothetical protein [Nocardia inohanensis]|uniref:hypothetical protein n=1 Tax=Nocardia inohanensis TaxID=209246 RepID=UPI0012F77DAD|nr:hypothetical protein [Nocardia inohanensis]